MKHSLTFLKGSRSVAIMLLALVCAIVLNMTVGALPSSLTKLDTTTMKMFDLSEQTEMILSELDVPVEVYWIVTTGAEDAYIQTLLERYSERSGKLQIIKKDPKVDPTFVQKYYSEDVQDNSLVVRSGERYQCVPYSEIFIMDQMAYIMYGEQKFTFEGENALTGGIVYVTNEDLPKIYNLTGHGELELPDAVSGGIKRQGMELISLNLLTSADIPADADGVLIHGPQRDISEKEKTVLSEFLKKGGSLLCITGPSPVGNEHPNLESLLTEYAITPRSGMVGETETNHFVTGQLTYLLPDIAAHAITNPLKEEGFQVLAPYAKSLEITFERPDTLRVTELLTTTKDSFAKQGDNEAAKKEEGDLEGPFVVAASAEDQVSGARVVCISAMYFLNEEVNAITSGGNQDFFLNSLSWMCQYDDGISIHPKNLEYETLTMDNSTAGLWITVLLLIPVGYVAFGTVRFVQRKRK